jgi:LemA protein
MCILAAGVAVVATIAWVAGSTFNRLMALETRCDTAFADIDVLLKRRHDLIPALVETVKGASKYEADTLTSLTRARAEAMTAMTPDVKLRAEKALSANITQLLAAGDRLPDLKASAHFNSLRDELTDTENRVTAARRFYNLAIEEYNATLRQFPGNVIGARRRLSTRRPFDLGLDRLIADEPVAVKF